MNIVALWSFVQLCAALSLVGCSDDPPVAPPVEKLYSHDIEWFVDTIQMKNMSSVTCIWGDRNKMYLASIPNGWENGLFCWDGHSWNSVSQAKMGVGLVDGLDSSYTVFSGMYEATNSDLSVLDNGEWRYISLPRKMRYLKSLKVVSRNEFYLLGVDGLYRYKDNEWTCLLDSSDSELNGTYQFDPISMAYYDGTVQQFTSLRDAPREKMKLFLFQRIQEQYVPIDTFEYQSELNLNVRHGHYIMQNTEGIFSCSIGGIFEWIRGSWVRIYEIFGYMISGSRNNLFGGARSKLMHYNGIDWQDVTPPLMKNTGGRSDYIFAKDNMIVLAYSKQHQIMVYRGYIKER